MYCTFHKEIHPLKMWEMGETVREYITAQPHSIDQSIIHSFVLTLYVCIIRYRICELFFLFSCERFSVCESQ
jgi:hypothetical protein